MGATVPNATPARHRLLPEMAGKPLQAHLRKAEIDWRAAVGAAIEQVQGTLSLKEFAALLCREERQVARWKSGEEHAQLAAIFAVEQFHQPLVLALAALAGAAVEIETVVKIRRSA